MLALRAGPPIHKSGGEFWRQVFPSFIRTMTSESEAFIDASLHTTSLRSTELFRRRNSSQQIDNAPWMTASLSVRKDSSPGISGAVLSLLSEIIVICSNGEPRI